MRERRREDARLGTTDGPAIPRDLQYQSLAFPRCLVTVLPTIPVVRAKFERYWTAITRHRRVRLGDVTPDRSEKGNVFSPLGFPNGFLEWNFTRNIDMELETMGEMCTSYQTLAIIAIVDGDGADSQSLHPEDIKNGLAELHRLVPQAILSTCIVFGSGDRPDLDGTAVCTDLDAEEAALPLPAVLCDYTSQFLVELASLLARIQARMTVETPPARSIGDDTDGDDVAAKLHVPSHSDVSQSRHGRRPSLFNVLGTTERSKMGSSARKQKLAADLYLMSGRVLDALDLYAEAAAVSKSCSDHLWFALGLQGLLACVIVMKKLGTKHEIPALLLELEAEATSEARTENSNRLWALVDSIEERINALFLRSRNFKADTVPLLHYVMSNLRYASLLAVRMRVSNDETRVIEELFEPASDKIGEEFKYSQGLQRLREVCARAKQFMVASMPFENRCMIEGWIVTIFYSCGQFRSMVMYVRNLISLLESNYVSTQVRNASQLGQHPATINSTLDTGGVDVRFLDILRVACKALAGVKSQIHGRVSPQGGWAALRKILFLECIHFLEATSSIAAAVEFIALALKLCSGTLHRQEQISLNSSLSRLVYTGKMASAKPEFDFWFDFIIKAVAIRPGAGVSVPSKRLAAINASALKSGFIHSALKADAFDLMNGEALAVCGEEIEVEISIRNVFPYELDCQQIHLTTSNGVRHPVQCVRIAPDRVQQLTFSFIPTEKGMISVSGCEMSVNGSRTRRFGIFPEVPGNSLSRIKRCRSAVNSEKPCETKESLSEARCLVLAPQPYVRIKLEADEDSHLNMRMGERRRVRFTATNTSDIACDFARFEVRPEFASNSRVVVDSKAVASAGDKYFDDEYEMEEPVARLVNANLQEASKIHRIPPKSTIDLDVDIICRPGLESVAIWMYYGSSDEEESAVYEKIAFVVIQITALAIPSVSSVEIYSADGSNTDGKAILVMQVLNSEPGSFFIEMMQKGSATKVCEVGANAINTILFEFDKLKLDRAKLMEPIPVLNNEQYIMPAHGALSEIQEQNERRLFWIKCELLHSISLMWRDTDGKRGRMNLQGLSLGEASLAQALHCPIMTTILTIDSGDEPTKDLTNTILAVDKFYCFRIRLVSSLKSAARIAVTVNVFSNLSLVVEGPIRATKKVLVHAESGSLDGVSEVTLFQGDERQLDLPFIALAAGRFTFAVTLYDGDQSNLIAQYRKVLRFA